MEAAGLSPLGFVANDHALLIWGIEAVKDPAALLTPEGLRDGLEGWLGENAVMKRTFRTAATVAGLIEKNLPGRRKTGRQATFSSDILYDTLRKYDPGHLLLRITRAEAGRGLVDFGRIEEMLARSRGRLELVRAPRVTPLWPRPSSSRWAACRSRAAPRPASSPRPPPRSSPRPGWLASRPTPGAGPAPTHRRSLRATWTGSRAGFGANDLAILEVVKLQHRFTRAVWKVHDRVRDQYLVVFIEASQVANRGRLVAHHAPDHLSKCRLVHGFPQSTNYELIIVAQQAGELSCVPVTHRLVHGHVD